MERFILGVLIGAFLFGPYVTSKLKYANCEKKGGTVIMEPGLVGFDIECVKIEKVKLF